MINGGAGSPETRMAHAHLEFNGATAIRSVGGTLSLDRLTFGSTDQPYLVLDNSSFLVSDSTFPAATAGVVPVRGTGGIKSAGRGLFLRNFWGKVSGYNDACDFTGGNRPGPIVQFINNVFMGSDDDLLDLDSTDAWVEGNIFMHCHRKGSSDSASAVSGGSDNSDNSLITILGNLFYDVDHVANAKQTNFYTLLHNTIVNQNKIGSQDATTAVVILADDGTSQGAGRRFGQGIPLSEIVYAVIVLKQHLRGYIRDHGLIDAAFPRVEADYVLPLHLHSLQDLNARVGEFLDRAIYHFARGDEAESARWVA